MRRLERMSLVGLALVLGACSTHVAVRARSGHGATVQTAQVRYSTDSRIAAAVIIAVMLADGIRYFRLHPDGTRTPVEAGEAAAGADMPPPRVNYQDCAQPIDLEAGNLHCR